MDGIATLEFRDGTTHAVADIAEARDLSDQLEVVIMTKDFWVTEAYVRKVLGKHGHEGNAAGLFGIMTYPHPDDAPFTAYTMTGASTIIMTRIGGSYQFSARDILMNHAKFTDGYRRQFGTVHRTCFDILVKQVRKDLRHLNRG